ncbi:hypothetical protein [Cysteiniphilum sp. QT6929]|uniref:hypothetical protein n=1 Tax=Cysteiniphilum sp. QT6929 TaxID=2975055 RepID=UPI0024B33E02|nr:hypothetical protein [Cysteiniphilum sp. QT6929]WHN65800.1 hypothetical protein NYP54_00850 [Cysteiniphilum sp. QT6929]
MTTLGKHPAFVFAAAILIAAFTPVTLMAYQFKNNSKYYERPAEKEQENPRFVVGNLTLNEKIVISADMIIKGQDQIISLGTFCAYHKGNKGFPLRITSNEGGFIAKGLNNQGNLPYQILINKIEIPYNQIQSVQTNNHNFDECQLYESIAIKFSKHTIQNAKAGRYQLSLILQSR